MGNHLKLEFIFPSILSSKIIWDQYQYLGNCPPTPPLTQQQSIDNKLGLMMGQERGRWAVVQILILIHNLCIVLIGCYNLLRLDQNLKGVSFFSFFSLQQRKATDSIQYMIYSLTLLQHITYNILPTMHHLQCTTYNDLLIMNFPQLLQC